jgi:hypothetical protein
MSPMLSDANREIRQNSTPEESEQAAPIETPVLEGATGGSLPKIPRPETTATPRVNRSS